MAYLDDLNERQREAVLQTEGPVLIVAGAGAGKTKAITYRILHLIKNGTAPESILAITFTNKAAKEMNDRVTKLLASDAEINRPVTQFDAPAQNHKHSAFGGPFISTFHALSAHILRENSLSVGVSRNFSIYDRTDSVRAIKEGMKIVGIDPKQFEPGKILHVISREKGEMTTVEDFTERVGKEYFRKIVSSVWLEYEKILTAEKALDFDDLLLKASLILRKNQSVREHYQNIWKYIHIDEYQDTNVVQYQIAKMLAEKNRNICVVGDMDQSIYGWRGADIKNIMGFEKDYPESKIVLLEQNYRSTDNILKVANKIIAKNKIRVEKNLFTTNPPGEKIGLFTAYDEANEASFVSGKSNELLKSGVKPSEIAVLYRANFQSRVIEESFLAENIPYQVLGTRFFERKEVKDAVAYLRGALNPEGLSDIKRIINVPPRGIGKVTLAKIFSGQESSLPPGVSEKIKKFRALLSKIADKARTNKLSKTLKFIVKETGMEDLLAKGGAEDEDRLLNMMELVTFGNRYDGLDPQEATDKFLADVALASDQDELIKEKSAVRLMTVHAAKGLEFDYVFIVGLEDDLFPHKKMSEGKLSDSQAEEERRLFYVAVTRARKKVWLSYANTRTIFGVRQMNVPSEFLFDIDDTLIETEEAIETRSGKVIYFD